MNKFVQKRTKLFLIATWTFIAALFADGSNLDDLFPGTLVIHSDEDNLSGCVFELETPSQGTTPSQSPSIPQIPQLPKGSKQVPIPTIRVIFDQDSPSLTGESLESDGSFSLLFPDEQQVVYHCPIFAESLYIKFCTFLI